MSESYPDLKEIERRPQQYWNADGLPELMMGALWILWSTAWLLPQALPAGRWVFYYWMIVPFILVASGFTSGWATKKLKQRLTYPRSGYVEFREPGAAMKLGSALVAAAVSAGCVMLVMKGRTQTVQQLGASGVALVLAVAFLIPVLRWRLPHYLILSAASIGLAFYLAGAGQELGSSFITLFMVLGIVACLTGAFRLRRFLRKNPLHLEGQA